MKLTKATWYNVRPPSDVCWLTKAHVTIVISIINHGYWSFLHQLNAIVAGGLTTCMTCSHFKIESIHQCPKPAIHHPKQQKKASCYSVQWEVQDPIDGGTCLRTIFLAIWILGIYDIPLNLGLKNRPKIYGRYLQFRFLRWPVIGVVPKNMPRVWRKTGPIWPPFESWDVNL